METQNILSLPTELLVYVSSFCSSTELSSLSQTCRKWSAIIKSSELLYKLICEDQFELKEKNQSKTWREEYIQRVEVGKY